MSFTPRAWTDYPSSNSLLEAADLVDLELRVYNSAFTDAVTQSMPANYLQSQIQMGTSSSLSPIVGGVNFTGVFGRLEAPDLVRFIGKITGTGGGVPPDTNFFTTVQPSTTRKILVPFLTSGITPTTAILTITTSGLVSSSRGINVSDVIYLDGATYTL